MRLLSLAEAPVISGNSCIFGAWKHMLASDSSPSFPAAKTVSKSQVRTSCLTCVLFHGFFAAVAPGAFHVAYVKPRFCFYTEV